MGPLLRLRLIPGTDTTAMATGLMAMDTTTERGLLRLSPRPLLMLLLRLLLIPGMDTTAGVDTEATMAMPGLMATTATTERGLLRLSLLLRLLLPLRPRLIPGTDTTAMASTDPMAMDTMDTGLMAMDTTMERGLLMLSLLLMLLLPPRPRLIPGTDTTDTGLMATTGERSKEYNFCQTAAN